MKYSRLILFLLLSIFTVASCSRKKDSWTSRTYHENVSRFNTYFNGEQAYIKGVATVEEGQIDDYYQMLSVFKWGDEKLRQSVVPDMDRAVEKGTKVIKKQSMEIKGKQKNKYVVKSYMLIGKARFYKGDYFPSLETFNYVITKFENAKAGRELVLEAHLWAAKCQVQIGNNVSASNYLDEVYRNKKLDKNLNDQVSATMAQMNINEKNYEEAYTNLREAVLKSKNKEDEIRWIYIMGQLQEKLGNRYESSSHYKKVVSMGPSDYNMLFTAQLKRALNFDVLMEDTDIIYRELERMLNDDKNIELRDQIYYVMAKIALEEEDYPTADKYLKKSVSTSVSNKKQKGESFTKLAEISFMFKEYVEAQAYYDSAFVTLPTNHVKYSEVQIRKESLTELVGHILTIEMQDSLQKLSNMSLARQTKLIEQYIENLKEEEERQAEEAEILALNASLAAESGNASGGPSVGGAGGWYFYNDGVRSSGVSSFLKIWGDRKLEDGWRQKNKTANQVSIANSKDPNEGSVEVGKTVEASAKNDKYDVNYYLAKIPSTEEEIDTSNQMILRAYVALGRIYYQKLNDWRESVSAYKKSISRYPGNKYEPRTLYFLFLIYSKEGLDKDAEEYKTALISKYPTTEYALLLSNPDRFGKKDENYFASSAAYEECFNYYTKKSYKSCLKCIDKANKKLEENNVLKAKFKMLSAYCIGKTKKQEVFEEALKAVINDFPGTPEAGIAKAILDQIGGLMATEELLKESPFKATREEKHRFIVIVHQKGLNLNQIRNDVTDYNGQFHKFENLKVQNIFLDGQTQMLMVLGLENAVKAEKYLKGILMNQKIMGYLPAKTTRKILISESNFKTFYELKDEDEYLKFFYASYKTE